MFDSAHDATQCALAMQRTVTARTAEQSAEERVTFRMAVNVADAIIEKDEHLR